MIVRRGKKWVVLSEAGDKLGEHPTEWQAQNQLRAIEASKARRKKGKGWNVARS